MSGAQSDQIARLGDPTPSDEIKKRPIFNKQKERVGELDYIDARFVMDRLDSCVGPSQWQDEYRTNQSGGIVGRIGILVERASAAEAGPITAEWVWKEDVGTESTIEEVKGSYSDAFKRAGVKWGIGRDLYDSREDQQSSGRQVQPVNGQSTTQMRAATGRKTAFPVSPDDAPWSCPVHDSVVAWPAGVSANGRAYEAFYACGEGRSCDQRPPYGLKVRPDHLGAAQTQQEGVPYA